MSKQLTAPRTLPEVRDWFFQEGLPVTEWARQHGFRPEAIYSLLAGRTRGSRGQAHRAAVALGLKSGPKNFCHETSNNVPGQVETSPIEKELQT